METENRSKTEIVLRALLNGMKIELDGQKVFLKKDENGNKVLSIFFTRYTAQTNKKEITWMEADFSFNWFLNSCEKLNDNEIIDICKNSRAE